MLAYLSLSLWQKRFSLRGCRLWIGVDITWYFYFQAAFCSLAYPQVIVQLIFSLVKKFQYKVYNAKWELSWNWRIHHIMPIAADSERGLGVFNPPPLQCVAVRKRDSYWSPLPLSSSPDFSTLNGILHYTCCSWSSPVQGLNCMHWGWHCTVHYP